MSLCCERRRIPEAGNNVKRRKKLKNSADEIAAVVTRNSYGCLVNGP
jgi:hypothetical protein